MSFSPPVVAEVVCLKKAYKRGVTGTEGPSPQATPALGETYSSLFVHLISFFLVRFPTKSDREIEESIMQ